MRKFFTVIARIIAALFAILFVVTLILAILLTTLNQQMFNARLYKNALVQQNIYERLPEIVGLALTNSFVGNPCSQNQLACSIDGASPELKACLISAMGSAAFEAIGSGNRKPTDQELQLAQPCLEQYGAPQPSSPPSGNGAAVGMPPFMQNLTAANWQAILTILLPPDNLKTMTESTLDQLFAYLNGQTNTVTVSLDKLKGTLKGPGGIDLILQLLNSQPPCTSQELTQMANGMSTDDFVFCKPPQDVLTALAPQFQSILNSVVQQIPDVITLIKPPAPGTTSLGNGPFGADPTSTFRTLRLIMRVSLLIPFAFLLLVTLFAVRSLKSWMRWWGIPIFISGAVALGIGLLILPGFNAAWTAFIVPRIPPFIPADIAGIGQELVRTIIHSLSGSIILPAIFLLVVGLAAWIGSTFIKSQTTPDVPGESSLTHAI